MSQKPSIDRRSLLKGGLAAGAATVISGVARPAAALEAHDSALKFGIASYSLRAFSRARSIELLQELGSPWVNIKSFHLPYEDTPQQLRAGRREFEEAGIEIVGGGTIYFRKDEDDDVESYFRYAKHCGMPLMVIGGTADVMPRVEKFVKRYDIKVAIHNHGPEDEHFPTPASALEVIGDMDQRVGLCIDVGHTARAGVDVAQAVAQAGSRLLDMHFKDLTDLSKRSDCIVGEGKLSTAAILQQLLEMRFNGHINLEYEIDKDDPVPGMKQSLAYLRGVTAGLTA